MVSIVIYHISIRVSILIANEKVALLHIAYQHTSQQYRISTHFNFDLLTAKVQNSTEWVLVHNDSEQAFI